MSRNLGKGGTVPPDHVPRDHGVGHKRAKGAAGDLGLSAGRPTGLGRDHPGAVGDSVEAA